MKSEILHLTLKKKWFDMIASGEKKEEYREVKPYWASRLTTLPPDFAKRCYIEDVAEHTRDFGTVHFYHGGSASLSNPNFKIECKGVEIREGNPNWGAEPGKKYFVIELGEIIK